MDKEFNLISVIRTILAWKKPLIIVTVSAAVISALFSLFVMDEYYYSWSTIYPTNQYLTDRSMIFNTESSGGQINYFGDKNDVNRLLSIANSSQLAEYIIDSFKLTDHYKIDKSSKYWKTKVSKEFEENYKAIKTEQDALNISIYDTDPTLAAAMVNTVVNKIDELNKLHVDESKQTLYKLISDQIGQQQQKVDDYDIQLADMANKYNIKVTASSGTSVIVNGSDSRAVQDYKTILEKKTNALKELNNRINIKEQMEVSLKSNSSSLFVVEKAFAADKKEKPVRWIVVSVSTIITFIIAILGIFFIEQIREIREQL